MLKNTVFKRFCHIYVYYYWKKNVDESYYRKHIFDTQFSSVNCGIDFVSAIFDAISVVNNDLYSIL